MIKAEIFRNESGGIYGFSITDHGDSIVCAAVSALSLNTVNSIENFTDRDFTCDYDEKGGKLIFNVPFVMEGGFDHDVNLLFQSLLLGLRAVSLDYNDDIEIIDEEV